jgi:hypothetical protein
LVGCGVAVGLGVGVIVGRGVNVAWTLATGGCGTTAAGVAAPWRTTRITAQPKVVDRTRAAIHIAIHLPFMTASTSRVRLYVASRPDAHILA